MRPAAGTPRGPCNRAETPLSRGPGCRLQGQAGHVPAGPRLRELHTGTVSPPPPQEPVGDSAGGAVGPPGGECAQHRPPLSRSVALAQGTSRTSTGRDGPVHGLTERGGELCVTARRAEGRPAPASLSSFRLGPVWPDKRNTFLR